VRNRGKPKFSLRNLLSFARASRRASYSPTRVFTGMASNPTLTVDR
jgi:hypothetical protein